MAANQDDGQLEKEQEEPYNTTHGVRPKGKKAGTDQLSIEIDV